MDHEENERQYKQIDQLLSMHSALRDRFARRALFLKISTLCTSVILCALVLADEAVFEIFGLRAGWSHLILGAASVMVFIFAIIELVVDWGTRGQYHDGAVDSLSELKLKYRTAYSVTDGDDSKKNQSLGREYRRVMTAIPTIPDREFNKLKAYHAFKVSLSRRISKHPLAPVWFLSLQLRCRGLLDAWRNPLD